MARMPRDARLENREARARLNVNHEPYWRQVHPGLSIGYRKGPRGATWVVRWFEGGRYRKRRLGIADDHRDADGIEVLSYRQAHRKALSVADSTGKAAEGVRAGYTVADAINEYLEWYEIHRSAKGLTGTRHVCTGHILPAFGKRRVEDLTSREIRRWHEGLAKSPPRLRSGKMGPKQFREMPEDDPDAQRRRKSTANRVLTVLKAALNFAYREGRVQSDDAWRRVKPFRAVEAAKVRYLAEEECARLLGACDDAFRPLVRAALLTGCRYGELTALRCDDYHADAGTVLVRASKGGRARHVPLTDEGQRFFAELVAGRPGGATLFLRTEGRPWGRSHQARPLKAACEKARINPPATFHNLRDTYASALAMRGVSIQTIAELLGHSDTRMTFKHYAHLMPSYIAETVRNHLPDF